MKGNNIYISTSCIKESTITRSIRKLISLDCLNIELSGGTLFSKKNLHHLLQMKDEFNLNYLLHNYFPPPKKEFVINLSSSNSYIHKKSLDHCKKAIEFSYAFGSKKFSVHSGFLIDIPITKVGLTLSSSRIKNRKIAIEQLISTYNDLKIFAGDDVSLYLENNVLSDSNYQAFNKTNPFLFTSYEELEELFILDNSINFLLDIAHLKVSCNTLKLDFSYQLEKLLPLTDYIHISDNNSYEDQNLSFDFKSSLIQNLKKFDLKSKTITLEVYEDLNSILKSYSTIKNIIYNE